MRHPVSVPGRIGPIVVGWAALAGVGLGPVALGQGAGARPATRGPAGNPTPVVSRPAPPAAGAARPAADALGFANKLYRERRYDLAAEEYEQVLRAAQGGTTEATADEVAGAWFGLGNARLSLQRYKEARQAFEGFLKAAPDHPNALLARYRVGEAAYVLGDLPEAKRSLEAYLAGGGGDARFVAASWVLLGDIAVKSSDLAAARRAYEQALGGDLKGALGSRARLGLGRVLAAQRESAPALAVLRELIATGGPEWLDKAWLQVGQVEAASERWDEAVAAFEALEKAAPRSPLVAEGRVDRAEALAKLGRRAEAEALLRPIAADPQAPLSIAASDVLATVLLADNRPADALEALDAALARPGAAGPSSTALRFHAAEAARLLGRSADARARFAALLAAEPRSTWADDAQLRVAALALDAKDYDVARDQAGPFAQAYPDSPLRAEAHLIAARAALGLDQPKEAIAILAAGLADDKPRPAVAQAMSYYLGLAYQRDGQADKASESLGQVAGGPAAADARYMLGQADFEAGRYEAAIPALEKYFEEKPRGDVADHALARIAQAQAALGRAEAADAALARLAEAFPRSPTLAPTRLRLAELAREGKQLDRAIPLFRLVADAKDADPASAAAARAGLGWSLLAANQPAEAAEALARAIELAPDAPAARDARFALGRALQEAKRTADAIAAYEKAVADQPDAPQAGPAALALARLQVEAKQPDAAAKTYATVVDRYAATAGVPAEAVLAEWGWALDEAGQAAEAAAVFERLLKDHPAAPQADDARFVLAEAAAEAHDDARVLGLLGPLVAPGSAARPALVEPALYRVGQVEFARRDWAAARATFDRLLADFAAGSLRRPARLGRAEAAFQAEDYKAAEADLSALIADPPAEDEPPALAATARGRLVQALVQQRRWDDALAAAAARAATNVDPQADPLAPEVECARGEALQGKARFDDARAALDRAIALRPKSEVAAQAQWLRGETFFHQQRYRDALLEFYRVAREYNAPRWQAAAYLEAGKVHEKRDEWKEAVEEYEKLRARFPQDPSAAEAAPRLEAARRRAGAAAAPG